MSLTPADIDGSLLVHADGLLGPPANEMVRGTARQQALRLVCRAGDEGRVFSKGARSQIASAAYDLYRDGLLKLTPDQSDQSDPPVWIYHPTPLALHVALLLETEPAPGKTRFQTVYALHDAAKGIPNK